MTFTYFWGIFSYLAALLLGVFLVAKKIVRRPRFVLRAVCCVAAVFLYKILFDRFLDSLTLSDPARLSLRTLDSFLLYTLSMLSVGVCYECDIWAMLFCATSGYCMQHMSQRTYMLLRFMLLPHISQAGDIALLCFVTAAYYVALYFSIIQKADYRGTMLDSRIQIMVSFVAVAIMIFLTSFALNAALGSRTLLLYVVLFSALSAFLAFFVEFGWLAAKKAEIESSVIRQIAQAAQKNYLVESDIIDLMNIKCHDLKHQLASMTGPVDAREIESLQRTVNVYDSIFKTGNQALDVTLTRISLLCEKKNITLTCSMDGAKLHFLSEADTYSLFSNLLDNAIEAVDRIQTPGKRLISLTTHDTPTAFVIHEENYTESAPQFENGLPQTTKIDKLYHGFGTKSMRRVCEKYGGECTMSASDGIFEVDIRFPHTT